ncbi:MAG: archease [Candidatus Bathyarchaeota archaeon]|nr:archease [Candidatus Bathyarchaeota archaeon]MDH5688363.1 archease [Candidatus Bathyarchaeota archaeon]
MKKRFEFLDHMADAFIAAYGANLAESFENAAVAMFEVMTDTALVDPRTQDAVEVEEHDKKALLYSWLEDLLVRSELNGMLYSKFKVLEIAWQGEVFRLDATIWGEPFDENKHKQKVGVKAVTYHRMEIIERPGEVTLKFILDI